VVAARDGVATEVREAVNAAASPFRFEVDGPQLYRLLEEIEGRGDQLGAIYHSHTRSEPYPSQTDLNFAALWPGVEWIIVGMPRHREPLVRTYRIDEGRVTEVELEVGE